MKRLCFYHRADLDGKCSAAIVRLHFGLANVSLIGIDYGDGFPWELIDRETEVHVVDFSLQPFEEMERLAEVARKLVWVDHHSSALKEAEARRFDVDGYRMTKYAGCELAWQFYIDEATPSVLAVRPVWALGRYDTWAWKDLPKAEADEVLSFQMGMRMRDNDPRAELWDALLGFASEDGPDENLYWQIVGEGRLIVRYEQVQAAIYARAAAFRTELDGLKVLAVNRAIASSQLFDSVWPDHPDADAMCAFGWRSGKWHVHLYTDREGVNVGEVAKARGGGGHVGAAGFQCAELPFELAGTP